MAEHEGMLIKTGAVKEIQQLREEEKALKQLRDQAGKAQYAQKVFEKVLPLSARGLSPPC
jgi:hypothetical protein